MSNEQNELRNFNDGEWCWINKTVIQEHTSKVGPIGITVYCFLASMVNSDQKCFPSQKYIAEKLGCSRATVSRTLKRLESDGLVKIERQNRYHCAYHLLKVGCHALKKPEQKVITDETQTLHTGNSDLHQSYTNDNHLTRNINDIDNIKTGEHQKEFTPKTREELLALDLADALNDRKALALYLSYARRFPESLLRKALGEAKEMPSEQIRKSRAALFNHLVRKYVKEYKNSRYQSGN